MLAAAVGGWRPPAWQPPEAQGHQGSRWEVRRRERWSSKAHSGHSGLDLELGEGEVRGTGLPGPGQHTGTGPHTLFPDTRP